MASTASNTKVSLQNGEVELYGFSSNEKPATTPNRFWIYGFRCFCARWIRRFFGVLRGSILSRTRSLEGRSSRADILDFNAGDYG